MMTLDRLHSEAIYGARIWVAKIGDPMGEATGTPATRPTVSDSAYPEEPESYANPGDWLPYGRIKTAEIKTDYKTADIEGVVDDGTYEMEEMRLATKRKISSSTNDITPEAWQLTFGLRQAADGTAEQRPFASGSDTLEVWLCLELTDAYRAETGLARVIVRGKLCLTNPLSAKSDPAQADYELTVVRNALETYVSAPGAGDGGDSED